MTDAVVLIVGAFGRGQVLSAELSRQGIPTTLIDVSELLGACEPADAEGPLGIFTDDLNELELERMRLADVLSESKNGWTLMLESGPLEIRGDLAKHRIERLAINWLPRLGSHWSSRSLSFDTQIDDAQTTTNLQHSFSVRQLRSDEKRAGLAWCQEKGVQVLDQVQVVNIAREGSMIASLQLRKAGTETTEVMRCERLVWALTGEETNFLSSSVSEKIFPGGTLKPIWRWVRFHLGLGAALEREVWPRHGVWLADPDLTWTHENLIVLQKQTAPGHFDAWVRLPFELAHQQTYLEEKSRLVIAQLNRSLVTMKFSLLDEDFSQMLGAVGQPTRQPLFNPESLAKWSFAQERNFDLHSPEVWRGLGRNAMLVREREIKVRLQDWWKLREAKRLKQELKGKSL